MSEKLQYDIELGKDSLSPALDKASSKASRLGVNLETAVSVLAGNLLTNAFESFVSGLNSIVSVTGDAISAASSQEVALNNLNASLARAGNYSKEASKELEAFSTAIQNTTVYEDDAIQSSLALLQSLTDLNSKGLQKGVQAAADLATVLSIDLDTAIRLVAKGANGNVEAFTKFGISVEKGSSKSEAFANLLNKLNESFGGASQSQLNTYRGSLTSLNNAYGDLLEPIGDIVVKNTTVIALFNTTKETLNQLNRSVSGSTSELQSLLNDGLFAASVAARVFLDALDGITRTFSVFINAVGVIKNAIVLGLVEPFRIAYDGILLFLQQIPLIGKQFENVINPLEKFADSLRNDVVGGIEDVKNAVLEENIFTKLSDGVDIFTNKVIESNENIILSGNGIKNSNAERVLDEDNTNKEIIKQREDLNNQLLLLQGQLDAEQKSFEQQKANDQLANGPEKDQAVIEAIRAQKVAEAEAIFQSEAAKADLIKTTKERDLAREVAFGKAKLAVVKANNEAERRSAQETVKFEQDLQNSRIAATQGFLAAGISLAKQGSREQKALQTASALISTYTAANQALSSPPGPPYTLPLVAATIAQGLANVSRINSVKGFATGGIVGNSGATMGPDNTTINARNGEMVLNADQQKVIYDSLVNNSFNGGGDIVIKIDEREIARAVKNQIKSGYRLGVTA